MFAVAVLRFAALLLLAGANQTAAANRSLVEWTLATADTTLVIGVGSDRKPYLYELRSPAGWNWTATPSPLPLVSRVHVGDSQHTLNWAYQTATEDRRDGTSVTLTLTNAEPALELTSSWQARQGPGPVRHTLTIKNRSASKVTLFEQESLELQIVGPGNDTSVWYINDDGSTPDPIGVFHDRITPGYQKTLQFSEAQDFIPYAVVDAQGRHGLYVGWEWSIGRIVVAASSAEGGVQLKAGNGDGFKTDLEAGETFEVPPGFIGVYQGDLDDAANSLHRYLFNYSMPAILRDDPTYPKLEWNAFAATGKGQGSWDSTETNYYPLIDAIAPLGFEEVVLDIGWWPGDATHKPHPPVGDPVDWPSGILAARNYAHNKGLRFGLYWNCNPSMTTLQGQQHRRDDIRYLYDKYHVDFWRSDGTDGNVLQTGGYGPGTRAHFEEDVGYWQTKGYYEVLDSLYATQPNFSYENCSGGGRIKDYGILRRCMKIQNQDRYYPIDARRSFYDSSYALHPMQLAALCGSWAEWQATGSVYEFRCASLGAAYWHPDAPNSGNGGPVWTDSQKALIKDAVDTYKTWLRPLIRTANLYHIFPRPDDNRWDGIEYYDPVSRKGAVYLFRPNSPSQKQVVKLKGLDAKAAYWLWGEDGSISPTRLSGDDLMQSGLPVNLPQPFTSDILFVQEDSLGRPPDLLEPGEFRLKPAVTTSQLLTASAELSWETSKNARFYRVTVGERPELTEAVAYETVTTPSVVLSRLPPARLLYWKVEAISRGGCRAHSGSTGTFTTADRLAKGVTFASDMLWAKANAGANNPVRRDKNLQEKIITINGRVFEKGLWTHAFNDQTPADVVFDLSDRKFSLFKASVGLEDLGAKGSIQFQVLGDGQKKAESPIMLPKRIHDLVVDVTGVKELTLRVLNGGDGYAYDHAVWGWARFLEAGVKDPFDDAR
ncbi:MAG: NPCBM/NEW2 domain-containing protein [Verrucomicrobia bacterium]|nr:NPCBM/NEW2 domain-containing protein [Verrucomicrobiota bacterium]